MKRKTFLLVILVFLFNSCVSFDVPASRSQGSEPRYESNVYSSNLSQIDFEKDAGIIVFCDILDNSLMQVATEKNIVDALERRGVRAYSFSSYTIPDETIDNLVSQMYDLIADTYILFHMRNFIHLNLAVESLMCILIL